MYFLMAAYRGQRSLVSGQVSAGYNTLYLRLFKSIINAI